MHDVGSRLRGRFVNCMYRVYPRGDAQRAAVCVGFAVGKKIATPVRRNALRRRMKEAYRRSKLPLTKAANRLGLAIDLVFAVSGNLSSTPAKMNLASDISSFLDTIERQIAEGVG